MKRFVWTVQENELLRDDHGICFEAILFDIENGEVLDVLEHPNQAKHGNQRILMVALSEYAYRMPGIPLQPYRPTTNGTRPVGTVGAARSQCAG